jgi:hypothetical protein
MHYRLVLMRFRDAVSADQIREVQRRQRRFAAIEGVAWAHAGLTLEPDQRLSYTHALVVGFANGSARDAYLTNPVHRDGQAAIHPLVEDFLIVDGRDAAAGS